MKLNLFHVGGSGEVQKCVDLLQEEDGPLMSYLLESSGVRKGLGPPINDDWDNVHHFVKFLKVFYNVTMKIYGSLYATTNLGM
jgi:hypothetical protein